MVAECCRHDQPSLTGCSDATRKRCLSSSRQTVADTMWHDVTPCDTTWHRVTRCDTMWWAWDVTPLDWMHEGTSFKFQIVQTLWQLVTWLCKFLLRAEIRMVRLIRLLKLARMLKMGRSTQSRLCLHPKCSTVFSLLHMYILHEYFGDCVYACGNCLHEYK